MKKRNKKITYKQLVKVKSLIEILELTLQTAFIKPYAPTSLLIIAKPESGKTSSMQPFVHNDWIYYTNEITGKMIIDEVLEKAKDKKIRFLMIPDLLNCIEKQKSSRQQFLNLIKSAIEEGVNSIQTYYKKIESKEPIKIGFITAITQSNFSTQTPRQYKHKLFLQDSGIRKYLEETGILSRFVPFSYDYPLQTIKEIFDYIEGIKDISKEKIVFKKISTKEEEILGSPIMFKQLELISRELGTQYSAYGIRMQERLQNLAKANAKINNRKEVIQKDIDKIIELSKWINFSFNPI